MSHNLIDLRSDTVTVPSEEMREVMRASDVGDDVYAEDPTINRLEAYCAEITGKEAGLFVPSGSMANLISQLCYLRRGDEVIIGQDSHCFCHEVGSGAAFAGAQYQVIPGNGLFTAEEARPVVRPPTPNTPGTALIWIESTHNMGGGIVWDLDEIQKVRELCGEHDLPLHLDGARVFNAAEAAGVSVQTISRLVDSLSFCFSKGLGAPVGSVLCGSRDFRARAHRFRKMLGGGMRQAGVLAAAAMYALQNNVKRLAEDHANASFLAESMAAIPGIRVEIDSVQTNIVMARVEDAPGFAAQCREHGVLFHPLGPEVIRLVTHLNVNSGDIERALGIIAALQAERN